MGQTETKGFRDFLEGKTGFPQPLPVSQFKLAIKGENKKLVGDPKTEIYVGRLVFPTSNIDPDSLYLVSSRSAPRDMVRLMKIDGSKGTWHDFPIDPPKDNPGATSFRRDFLVASPQAEANVQGLLGVLDPIFEDDPQKKANPFRASAPSCRSMMILGLDFMSEAVFSKDDAGDVEGRQEKADKVGAYILSALGTIGEALEATGAGYDTNYIGPKAYMLLVRVGVQASRRLMALWTVYARAFKTKRTEDYEELSEDLTSFLTSVFLWGELLHRAVIWTNVTGTSQRQTDQVMAEFLVTAREFLKESEKYEAEAAAKSGMTVEQLKALKAPVQSYVQGYYSWKHATSDVAFQKMLAEAGADESEWAVGHSYSIMMLEANTENIRKLQAPPSMAPVLDPKVYSGLLGLFQDFSALGANGRGLPKEGRQVYEVNLERLRKEKARVESLPRAERDAEVKRVRDKVVPNFLKIVQSEVTPTEEWIKNQKFAERDRLSEDADLIKRIFAELNAEPEGTPAHSLARAMVRSGDRALLDVIRQVESYKSRIRIAETRAETEPYDAIADLLNLYSVEIHDPSGKFEHVQIGRYKIWELAETFSLAFKELKMPSWLAAETFRSKVVDRYGLEKLESSQKMAIDSLKEKIKEIDKDLNPDPDPITGVATPPPEARRKVLEAEKQSHLEFITSLEDAEAGRHKERLEAEYAAVPPGERGTPADLTARAKRMITDDFVEMDGEYRSMTTGSDAVLLAVIDKFMKPGEEAKVRPGATEREIQRYTELNDALNDYKAAYDKIKKIRDTARSDADLVLIVARSFEELNRHKAAYKAAYERLKGKRTPGGRSYGLIAEMAARQAAWADKVKYAKWTWNVTKYTLLLGIFGPQAVAGAIAHPVKWQWLRSLIYAPFTAVSIVGGLGYCLVVAEIFVQIFNLIGVGKIASPLVWVGRKIYGWFHRRIDGGKPKPKIWAPEPPEDPGTTLSTWELIGLGGLVAVIAAPRTVIPGVIKVVRTVVGGISSIITGKKGRGRPAGPPRPVGAPPNIEKAIENIKKGQKEGNPFLVKKGVEALKKAKAMGLPVPKGIID